MKHRAIKIDPATHWGTCEICGEHGSFKEIPRPSKKDPNKTIWICTRRPRKAGVKRKVRTSEQKMNDVLDALWRSIVKVGGKCVFAGRDGIACSDRLEAMHGLSRGWMRIRWDLDNGFCGCSAHHRFYTMHPVRWAQVIEEMYPGRWAVLDERRNPALKKMNKAAILEELRKR